MILPMLCAWLGAAPFVIEVVDDRTGRGVPLVELRTVNDIALVTDSNGLAAFDEPGLMDKPVFFHVKSHGYEFPKDGFGYRGRALDVKPGGSARLPLERINIAERLYRVTGAGIYRDTLLAGRAPPIAAPVLNARVLGSDSVVNAVYRGKIHWFWGDTNRPGYPLGNFQVPGATSRLPADGGLDPDVGVNLDYFTGPDGFARPTAEMPGAGPTWIFGLAVVGDRLFATYSKVKPPLEIYERGLVAFNDQKQTFEKAAVFPKDAPFYPNGQTFLKDGYLYFTTPYPLVRVKADAASLAKLETYEAFTCLAAGSRLDNPKIDRDPQGRPDYRWKRNAPPVGPVEQAKLVKEGHLQAGEALLPLQDFETGKAVLAHAGSIYWNEYRKRWVMIAVEIMGRSFLGEVWCAEAETPLGPWVYARKIVTHDRYSFYNPKQHPFFSKENGRVLYFEGTYTQTFSGNPVATPRYDYNQILYKLDLDDPRLNLPVLVRVEKSPAPFFALARPGEGTVPVYAAGDGLKTGAPPGSSRAGILFHALPAEVKSPPPNTVPLWEFREKGADGAGFPTYSTDEAVPGLERAARPVCRVWRNPMKSGAIKEF